jgi:aspartate oxidase
MDLLKTILCCNFNFELVTKAWTRQGKHVRNEVKVFLDSNTFPRKNVREQAPTLQNKCSKCWGISKF